MSRAGWKRLHHLCFMQTKKWKIPFSTVDPWSLGDLIMTPYFFGALHSTCAVRVALHQSCWKCVKNYKCFLVFLVLSLYTHQCASKGKLMSLHVLNDHSNKWRRKILDSSLLVSRLLTLLCGRRRMYSRMGGRHDITSVGSHRYVLLNNDPTLRFHRVLTECVPHRDLSTRHTGSSNFWSSSSTLDNQSSASSFCPMETQ
jgi:hypothetical protein